MQKAVPRQWSGPPAVLPRVGPFEGVCGVPERVVAPVHLPPLKRGVGPLWAAVSGWGSGAAKGNAEVRFLCGIKRWLTACHTAPQCGSEGTRNGPFCTAPGLFSESWCGSDFGTLSQIWLRNSRTPPPLSHLSWLRGGSNGHFLDFGGMKMSEEKMRIHTRISQEMERKISAAMEKDNCQSRNEFLEKAVKFYATTWPPRTWRSSCRPFLSTPCAAPSSAVRIGSPACCSS